MKQELAKTEKSGWIDIHNDELMVSLGMRQPLVQPRDESLYERNPAKQKLLKTLRRTCKLEDTHFHHIPQKSIPVRAKLIIYLKKNNKFANNVYSTICWQHQIGDILMQYHHKNRNTGYEDSLVSKYVYNGKEYSPEERPFWY